MDVNMVFECIGFGASRAVRSAGFPLVGSRVPARFILQTAKDPVAYCIEAYRRQCPDNDVEFDGSARAMILGLLEREAGVTHH